MIVVTGSNGFIGSNIIKNLNSLGISDILAVDNHDNEDLKNNINNCQIKEQYRYHKDRCAKNLKTF